MKFSSIFWRLVHRPVLVVITIVVLVTIGYMSIYAHNPFTQIGATVDALLTGSMMARQAPELVGIEQWFNSEPLTLAGLKGRVVLIDFWTYGCINCQRSIPYINQWHEKYADQGLVIIGVHTPEFRFESKPENIKKAIGQYNIKYPVALDTDYKTWRSFNNLYWPAKYLIDKNGMIVYTHFGEGAYSQTEEVIKKLLAE